MAAHLLLNTAVPRGLPASFSLQTLPITKWHLHSMKGNTVECHYGGQVGELPQPWIEQDPL